VQVPDKKGFMIVLVFEFVNYRYPESMFGFWVIFNAFLSFKGKIVRRV
jgi:hypothetical protein